MKSKRISFIVIGAFVAISVITVLYFVFSAKKEPLPAVSETTPQYQSIEPEKTSQPSSLQESQQADEINSEISKQNNGSHDIPLKDGLTFVKMGEPLTIRSKYSAPGEPQDEQTAYLSWDGDLVFTVTKAQVFDYDASRDDEWNDRFSILSEVMNYEDPAVLLLEIEVENIDASQSFGVKYEFHPNFILQSNQFYSQESANIPGSLDQVHEYISDKAYFSHHADGKDYYTFSLPEGESITFRYAYYISRKALDTNPLFLNPAGALSKAFYGIELDQIEGE